MNAKVFSEAQRLAILDLLVLAMYADGHLASVEDSRVHRWLTTMGFESTSDRDKLFDASVTRVRPHSHTGMGTMTHAVALLRLFISQEDRQGVIDVLDDLLASDGRVAEQESAFLSALKESLEETL